MSTFACLASAAIDCAAMRLDDFLLAIGHSYVRLDSQSSSFMKQESSQQSSSAR